MVYDHRLKFPKLSTGEAVMAILLYVTKVLFPYLNKQLLLKLFSPIPREWLKQTVIDYYQTHGNTS